MNITRKYPVKLAERFLIDMPTGSQLRGLLMVDGSPYLFAEINPRLPAEPRSFQVTTGKVDTSMRYLASCVMSGEIFHLHEIQ